jgi:hypothetical protein
MCKFQKMIARSSLEFNPMRPLEKAFHIPKHGIPIQLGRRLFVDLMLTRPVLIKRPVFEHGGRVTIGFGAAERAALLG